MNMRGVLLQRGFPKFGLEHANWPLTIGQLANSRQKPAGLTRRSSADKLAVESGELTFAPSEPASRAGTASAGVGVGVGVGLRFPGPLGPEDPRPCLTGMARRGSKRKAGVGGEAAVSSKRRLAVPPEACRTDSESERSARPTRLDAYASAG
ncbi:unnamed protein product, partial [Protopolystoma xenopodis]